MTTLTKLEKELLEIALPNIDATNQYPFVCVLKDANKLGWNVDTTKGVFSSLLKKDILCEDDSDDGYIDFTMPVGSDDLEEYELINTVEKMEKYLTERGVA